MNLSEPDPAPELLATDKAPRSAWFTLSVLVATLLFGFVDRQILSLVAAPLSKSLDLSDSQLGLVQGLAFSLFSVVFVYPIAMMADRIDRRIVLTICIVVWALGTAGCGLARNFEELFVAAALIAAGEAGLPALVYSAVPELFRGRQRLTANFIFFFASVLGVALGLALGGAAVGALDAVRHYLPASLQEVESWRLAFFVVAAPAPLFIALVFLTSLRRAGKPEAEPGQPDGLAMRTYLKRHGKPLGLVLFGATIFSFAFGGLIVWTPVAMARMFNATPAQNGAGLGLAIAAGSLIGIALGSILLPRLIKRLGRRAPVRVSWVAMLVGAPVVIAMPFVSAPWQAFLIVGEQMALSMMVGSLVPTMLQELAPAGLRARVVSFYTILSGAFGGLSVVAIGSLSDGVNEPRGLLLAVVATAIPAWIVAAAFMRAAESPFEISASEIALQELSASREL